LEHIYGSVRLRPTRIGFLIRPSQQNHSRLREVIRLCSCVWGGMFCPIIPVSAGLPAVWRRDNVDRVNGRGLADAYIRFFEPDVFVETEAGLANEAGITKSRRSLSDRVVSLKQFVAEDGRRQADFAFGLSVWEVYNELYAKEFKFASRRKRRVALFTDDEPFCEAVFGAFPRSRPIAHLRKAFSDICEPELFSPTPENCLRLFREQYLTPLHATLHEVDVNFENRDDPTIFVFDPEKVVDLVDFWNLRQFKPNVFPVNIHWFDQFAETIKSVIKANFRPLPGNKSGVMVQPVVEFARSIDSGKAAALIDAHMQSVPKESFVLKNWYDPIWRTQWRTVGIQPRRAKLVAAEVDIEEDVSEADSTLGFPALAPDFASKYAFVGNPVRWINVVNLANIILRGSHFALTFPPNVKGGDFPNLGYVKEIICTREGIVLYQQFKSRREALRLISQQEAVIGWFASRGVKAKPSSAGRNATQVLRSVGGADGCYLFADEGTVKLLDKMAKTIQREADGSTAQYPDRTASIAEWKEVLGRRSNALFTRAKLSEFTRHNIMRVGLRLSCPHCSKENWYSLDDVGYEVSCERCLNRYPFPQADIRFNEADWRFRVSGPFSVPDYADGAYATALTLRLFNKTLHVSPTPTTFSTGLEIILGDSQFEIDFAGWYTEGQKFWIDPSPVTVFGETKSFGTDVFKERDVQRLKRLAEVFPGSYVVFSAMKTKLADVEKDRIRKFAEWGRVPQKNGEPRAMVIVLTGTELFADHSIKNTWQSLGGRHAAMVNHPSVHPDDLWTLAEVTQQLYLEMSSYSTWRFGRRKKSADKAAS
jgi:hypothetical protein